MSMSDSGRGVSAGYSAGSNTAWSGWVIFAATMMVLVGCFTLIDGFVALLNSSFYGTTYHLLLGNYQSWGWWNLILGSLLVVTGLSLFTGSLWARIVGIIFASVNALSQLVFIAVFPMWALAVIAIDVVVIYALAVNREVA